MEIETMEHKKTEVHKVASHKILSRVEWLVARNDSLKREKALTHTKDRERAMR